MFHDYAHVFGVKLFGYFYYLMSSYVSNYNKFISNVGSMVEPLGYKCQRHLCIPNFDTLHNYNMSMKPIWYYAQIETMTCTVTFYQTKRIS